MKKTVRAIGIALVLVIGVAGVAYAAVGTSNAQVLMDLAAVRQATAKYHNLDVALADGYVPVGACVEAPGLGVMGFHYLSPSLAMDPAVDLATPEILLYAVAGSQLKLVGVEYFYAIGAPDAPVPDPAPPAPVLFGIPLEGPMLGHDPGMPPHYDLHVWVWQDNPNGMFAQFNPNVSCQ